MSVRASATRRAATYLWNFKLTREGKFLVVSGIVASVFAMPSVQIPIYTILLTMFAVGVLAFLVNLCYRPRLEVTGRLGAKTVAGEAIDGFVTVRNQSRFSALDIGVGFLNLPASLEEGTCPRIKALAGGKSVTVPFTIHPKKRGVYPMPPLRAFTTFPFNLLRSGRACDRIGALTVLPAFASAQSIDVPVNVRHQPGGIALTSHLGESPEYIGNREYRLGDSMRRIDARAWARLAKPIVREYQEEYFCRIGLILDTYVPGRHPAPPGGFPSLEAAISLGATVTDALSHGEFVLDIFAAGPELYVFRSGRHTAHFENVLEILACLEACRINPFDTVTPNLTEELSNISSAIFILLDWDQSRRELVRRAMEMGCRVKVLVVRDGDPTEPIDEGIIDDISVYPIEAVATGGIMVL